MVTCIAPNYCPPPPYYESHSWHILDNYNLPPLLYVSHVYYNYSLPHTYMYNYYNYCVHVSMVERPLFHNIINVILRFIKAGIAHISILWTDAYYNAQSDE